MGRMTIIEGNSNNKDDTRVLFVKGERGYSAYELYVQKGGTLTEEQWLDEFINAENFYNKDEIDAKNDSQDQELLDEATERGNADSDLQDQITTNTNDITNIKAEQTVQNNLIAKKPYYFNNVAEMKAYNLEAGDMAITKGYYSANDNGGAYYMIRSKATGEVEDNGFIHFLNNDLVAELLFKDEIIVNQLGCKGDGIFDNSTILNNLFSTNKVKKINFIGNQTYLCNSPIVIQKEFIINGNFATLKSTSNATAFSVNIDNGQPTSVHEAYFGLIKKLKFEAPNSQVVFENTLGYKGKMTDCYFSDFYNIGLRHINGYEMLYENLRFWGKGVNSIGIRAANNDVHYNNIFMCDCHTGLSLQCGANFINNFHAWIFDSNLYLNSKCIDITTPTGINYLSQIYIDSYNFGIYYSSYGKIIANEVYCLFNQNMAGALQEKNTSFMYYSTSDINNYDYQTNIKQIVITGGNENTQFSNITPENQHCNIKIVSCNVADYFKYNISYFNLTNIPSNVTIKNSEITRDENNIVHLKLIATITNAAQGYNTIGGFSHSIAPLNNVNIAGFVSTSSYMDNPSPTMFYLSGDIKVNLASAGTQTVYLDITYLAKNDKRNI